MCHQITTSFRQGEKGRLSVGKKAERAKQTRKAKKNPLLAASTYYHPLSPLPNEIDHLATINFGCNLLYKVMIALAGKPVKPHIFKQAPASDKLRVFQYTYGDGQNVTGGQA